MWRRVDRAFGWLVEGISLVLLSVVGALVFIQVVARYLFNSPLVWSEELARYGFVWLTFVGGIYAARIRAHIVVDLFVRRFPPAWQDAIAVVTHLLMLAVLVRVVPVAVWFAGFMQRIGSSAMDIPMGWIYAAVPVGLIGVGFTLVTQAVEPARRLLGHLAPSTTREPPAQAMVTKAKEDITP